jgi:hypothetical protein
VYEVFRCGLRKEGQRVLGTVETLIAAQSRTPGDRRRLCCRLAVSKGKRGSNVSLTGLEIE